MALHITAKLAAVSLVIASLVLAFRADRGDLVRLHVTPELAILTEPYPPAALPEVAVGPVANPRLVVRATGYNSMASQTDGSPNVTATGTRTRFGVLAVSRDLLGGDLPYGSLVRLTDLGGYYDGRGAGRFQPVLDRGGLFIVEDTMHARKREQVDVWFGDYASAVNWGVRQVEVQVVRYGYDGPMLDTVASAPFEGRPILTASSN